MKVLWKVAHISERIASFRYRYQMPAQWLSSKGIQSRVTDQFQESDLDWADAVILVKSFAKIDQEFLAKFKERGTPIWIDLCDHILYWEQKSWDDLLDIHARREQAKNFRATMRFAKNLVVPTSYLGQLMQTEFAIDPVVIPDPIDDYQMGLWDKVLNWHLSKPWEITFLWFGNFGIPSVYGISDLMEYKSVLEEFAKGKSFGLLVVTENENRTREFFKNWNLQYKYLKWSEARVHQVMKMTDLVLVPSMPNDFSKSKSANRTLLSLQNGAPVLATMTTALQELQPWILTDPRQILAPHFIENLKKQRAAIQKDQSVIQNQFSKDKQGQAWLELLKK